jgi:methionine synthase II (cobalamin-independent)
MIISIEPIGSIPRPLRLIQAIGASGDHADPKLDSLYEKAIRDTIERFEATGSPVITDAGSFRNSLCRRPYPPYAAADVHTKCLPIASLTARYAMRMSR